MSEPRQIAAEILQNTIENKTFFSEIKNNCPELEHKDLAFVNMLVLTALRHYVFIKKIMNKYAKKKLPDKVIFAQYALALGITELLYLNTPDYAVLNSYVDIVKKTTDKFVSGFVNAVLRKVAADKEQLLKDDVGDFFPSEFFKILNCDYGKKTVAKIQKYSLLEPSLDISVKQDPEIWAEKLGGTLLANGTIRLENNGKIIDLEGYNEGLWWIQDAAASLAVKALGDIKGKKVLDLCAAPGGKTAQLLSLGGIVTALDVSASRLETLETNLSRLNLKTENTICNNGLKYLRNFEGEKFDIIVLDAPCSATGTLRRHPEIVHIKTMKDITKQTSLQKDFLNLVGNALKKDGILVYCTCSISKLEGEIQIAEFLENNSDFKPLPITNVGFDEVITPEGYIRTLPHYLQDKGGLDAFFVAKLQKVN